MSTQVKRAAIVALAVAIILAPRLFAHEITVKGTVAAVEAKRLQVSTGQEKKNEAAGWYAHRRQDEDRARQDDGHVRAGQDQGR